jgi:hypothetical protein
MFFIDIVLSFFKQELDEEGWSKFETLSHIAKKYLHNGFLSDAVTFLPFGFLEFLDKRLKFLWIIKTFRVNSLNR